MSGRRLLVACPGYPHICISQGISKMEALTDEHFERRLQDVDTSHNLELLDSFYDPMLLPLSGGDLSGLLSFPPLPAIQEASPVSALAFTQETLCLFSNQWVDYFGKRPHYGV